MIRWGIIGCGDVTEVKSGPAFGRVADSELVAVMRRNGALAQDYASRHNVARWYDDATALIDDPDVNAVYVATPPDTHADYTVRALEAGKPVYVEKPMARTSAECQQMIAAAERAGKPLLVAYYRRRLPSFLHVWKLIHDGHIGDVRLVHVTLHAAAGPEEQESSPSNWRVIPEIAGGGYFVDLASHQFDFLDYAFGPVEDVGGQSTNHAGLYPAEDTVSASWKHESGVVGSGNWSFCTEPESHTEEAIVVGSRGRIRFSFFGEPTIHVKTEAGITSEAFEHPTHIQQPLIETVVNTLLGRGECPSTGYSAIRTTRVLETILG
jgi:predicted dehydrogenase